MNADQTYHRNRFHFYSEVSAHYAFIARMRRDGGSIATAIFYQRLSAIHHKLAVEAREAFNAVVPLRLVQPSDA